VFISQDFDLVELGKLFDYFQVGTGFIILLNAKYYFN